MRFTQFISSFAVVGATSMLIAGCGSDSKSNGTGAAATGGATVNGGAATTGGATANNGGAATTGGATANNGGAATTGGANTSAGGTTTTTTTVGGANATGGASSVAGSTLDDLIGAICHWEFKCCDAGEVKWELGPITNTEAACKEKFVYLLRTDTAAASPYPANNSPAMNGLLIKLGYAVDMKNVTENPAGIAACIAQWNNKTCNPLPSATPAPLAHCTASNVGVTDPCDLTNLVKPKLAAGDVCTYSLTQGAYNDVECVAGTTCLAKGDLDNPNSSYPTCVTRGVANAPCTFDKDCDLNFYCSSTGGKCTAKGTSGQTCAYTSTTAPVPNDLSAPCMPGLACNPSTLKCVENCNTDYICTSDYECPTGQSCVPTTIGNNSTGFKVCKAVGNAGTRCDTNDDCSATNYCDGALCAAQKGNGVACSTTVAANCLTGMYCNAATGTAGTCAPFINAGATCVQATGSVKNVACDPTTTIGCVHKGGLTADTYICSATLLANALRCTSDADCASQRCEYASTAASYKTCIAGAVLGDACDAILTSAVDGKTRCGPGLSCDATSAKCVAQSGAGGACVSAAGTADATLCKNATCNTTQWTAIAATNIMCTDATITTFNGGTTVTCDGQ